jgi:2'-hydroxyisoflavone reductase
VLEARRREVKILLIGGPRFIGLHLIERALEAGHEVTMFNRGVTNGNLFPELARIRGDRTRDVDLEQLRGGSWDAVVDTCGYDVRVVRKTLEVLRGSVGHYTYVSSIGYYADFSVPQVESGAPAQLQGDPDIPLERSYGGSAHYGPMKALCEAAVAEAFPANVAIRLTLGVGPTEGGGSSARAMNYWAKRVRDYDRVLVPGPTDRFLNFIDVRDMAQFMVQGAERGLRGPFNLAEPALPAIDMLTLFKGIFSSNAELVFVDPDWLLEQGVSPNTELPWWIPGEDHKFQFGVDGNKALANGLKLRPFADSIRDSVQWDDDNPPGGAHQESSQAGESADLWDLTLTRDRELALLAAWDAR